jgi:ubiquinone/menaquinone biosynthesis C-methylase UbiE
MFNNLINRHDFSRFIYGLRHGYLRAMISRLTKGRLGRVKDQWKVTKRGQATTWWMIPAIKKRCNYLITGDEDTDYFHYVAEKYLSNKNGLVALSLGCGNGHRERMWAELADFAKIEAYDISESRIKAAAAAAEKVGLSEKLVYQQGDLATLDLGADRYDVIFVEMSLHHFSPLEEILIRINRCLKPGGLFVVNEYVGPSRFQWTPRQLEVANGVFSILPEKYKKHVVDGCQIKKIIRPSRFSMIMKDPSESIESGSIIPLLKKLFTVIDERPYYGTILHPLFNGIAGNFISDDPETQRVFGLCLEIEDRLACAGDIDSDFTLAICRKESE